MDKNEILLERNDFKAFVFNYLQYAKKQENLTEYFAQVILDFTESFEKYYWGNE